MVERVQTGRTRIFDYGKDHKPRLDPEQKKEIEEAYGKYYERKEREKRNKIVAIIILILLVLTFFGVYLLVS